MEIHHFGTVLKILFLFYRNALCQVPWLVDVALARLGGIVAEELERDDLNGGLEQRVGLWQVDGVVADIAHALITLVGDSEDLGAAAVSLPT